MDQRSFGRSRRGARGGNKLAYTGAGLGIAAGALYLYLRTQSTDIPRDLHYIWLLIKFKRSLSQKVASEWTTAEYFADAVKKNPYGEAIRYLDGSEVRTYTFSDIDALSNRVANWGLAEGFKRKQVVALMMDNRPEFVITWLGLAKIGVITSLINTNLKGGPLYHSLTICNATHFIIGSEHIDTIRELLADKKPLNGPLYSYGGPATGFIHLDPLLLTHTAAPISKSVRAGLTANDELVYIYTSGTTGNPKASVIKHLRFFSAGLAFSEALEIKKEDVVYCTLPLYHSAGGMIGVGLSWYNAIPLVLRRKFSLSQFWTDCKKNNCTVIQYIGELCRYLLTGNPGPADKDHKVRLAVGNGLRPDIWKTFQERFGITAIGEFYGSTEGNAFLLNSLNRQGAVGFVTPLIQKVVPLKLVKFDIENEVPIRNKQGFCIECKPGEVGELLGLIEESDPLRQFAGYTDKAATEKKILRDVFVKGDTYFRTGDLLKNDSEGFFYFVDRIGDTFRWKGENVSTNEVAEVLAHAPGVIEANVYGVSVPKHDGRAGMACLVVDQPNFNLDSLYTYAKKNLPQYAAPVFIRLRTEIETTTTFKYKKTDLVKDGFDPSVVKDPLFLRDDSQGRFVPIDQATYDRIVSNTLTAKL
eukprot:TRINITY_DN9381_c0_g1_i1.p1 TRINITY_DN9381_c0_g1~~TRINITY_DN9381_c0_g1_i1.p1  ORF type:complete len:642 (-),score=176.36 TRINITY_DN9381_c0_g1_i1:163-2088(-)